MSTSENKRKWDSFLKPITFSRKEAKVGSGIKIKDKVPGTQYLSQTFANKLLEKTEKPIPVKGNLEELRKVTKNFRKPDVFSRPPLRKKVDRSSSPSGDQGTRITSTHADGSSASADVNRDSHTLTNRKTDVTEIAGTNNEGHRKSHPSNEKNVSSPDFINVELLENSSENPIAISDDESMDESLEDENFSIPRKRKQGNENDFEVSELPPPKRDRNRSPERLEEDLTSTEDTAKSSYTKNAFMKIVEYFSGRSIRKFDAKPSTDTTDIQSRKSPVSFDIRQTTSWRADTKERDSVNEVGSSELNTDHSSKANVDAEEENNTEHIDENAFIQSLNSDNINGNGLSNKKENDNFKTNVSFQASNRDSKLGKSSSLVKFDMNYEEEIPPVSAVDKTELLADMSAQQIPLLERDHSIERTRVRSERSPSQKDDIDKPCSQWRIELFARYFDFEDCVEELELDQHSGPASEIHVPVDQMVSNFRSRIKIASSTVTHSNRNSEETLNFTSLCRTEVGARLILNEIFFPLCSYLDLSVEIERNIDCSYLPNCRFDYRIVNSDGDVVGAVEAKSSGSLRPESVAQAVIELCILQTERLTKRKNSHNIGTTPLFNVLTDGVRYVFIVLQGDKLLFEQSFSKIRVREMTTWDKVKSLYKSLLRLLCMQKKVKGLSEVVEL